MPKEYHVLGWQIWYEDLTTHDSASTTWEKLPSDDPVAVLMYYSISKRLSLDEKYYWTMPSAGIEVFSSNEDPSERYPGAVIRVGKTPHPDVKKEIERQAKTFEWRTQYAEPKRT